MDECLRVLKESVKRGSVKCRLRTIVLGLENNGTIVVTYSFAWWKTIVPSLRFTLTGFKSRFDSYSVDHIPYYLSGLSCAHFFWQPFSKLLYMIFSTCGGSNPGGGRHAPPWNLSNLGAQTSHFLSFPQDIFIKKNPKEMPYRISSNNIRGWLFEGRRFFQLLLKLGSWINFQSLNHHSSVLLDQIPLHLYKVGIKERKDDERGGGGIIIRGRRLIEGPLFFKEIR